MHRKSPFGMKWIVSTTVGLLAGIAGFAQPAHAQYHYSRGIAVGYGCSRTGDASAIATVHYDPIRSRTGDASAIARALALQSASVLGLLRLLQWPITPAQPYGCFGYCPCRRARSRLCSGRRSLCRPADGSRGRPAAPAPHRPPAPATCRAGRLPLDRTLEGSGARSARRSSRRSLRQAGPNAKEGSNSCSDRE